MGKINQYSNASAPILSDKLIGTKVNSTPENGTYNFTLAQLLTLISSNLTANSFNLSNVTSHANNADAKAAGLVVGQVYRTGDTLKIVH